MKIIISSLALSLLLFSACGTPEQEVLAEDVTLEEITDLDNTTCPVMGLEVMDGQYIDWEGYRINFCCAGCDQTFLADPEMYMGILAEDPSVTADLSSYQVSAGCPDCTEEEMCVSCSTHMETACPDCTDEEMCEACSADGEPMACHTV